MGGDNLTRLLQNCKDQIEDSARNVKEVYNTYLQIIRLNEQLNHAFSFPNFSTVCNYTLCFFVRWIYTSFLLLAGDFGHLNMKFHVLRIVGAGFAITSLCVVGSRKDKGIKSLYCATHQSLAKTGKQSSGENELLLSLLENSQLPISAGCFTLNTGLLLRILGSTVTYLFILIQFRLSGMSTHCDYETFSNTTH